MRAGSSRPRRQVLICARQKTRETLGPLLLSALVGNQILADFDQRVQQAMELVFRKFKELGSVRQVLLWYRQENICLPAFPHETG